MHAASPRPPVPGPGAGPIVLAEDDQLIRGALADSLEECGYEVIAVDQAATVIGLLGRGLLPSVVITDIGLASGEDGVVLADEVHRLSPCSFVVFITGQADGLGERGLKDREVVLHKPFRFEALAQTLGRIVDSPPSPASAVD